MQFTRRLWGLGCAVLLSVLAAATTGTDRAQVHVLVYRNVEIPTAVLDYARSEAVRIFHAAGIQLVWINCSYGISTRECGTSSGASALVLHIIAGRTSSSDVVFGEAFLGEDGTGYLADLFYNRIRNAQRDFGINPGRLLGAVAAHEIGHLLLGSHSHLWIGIMTPVWSGDNLRLLGMGALFFPRQQAIHMQERLHHAVGLRAGN
jgi:hypothetical protein